MFKTLSWFTTRSAHDDLHTDLSRQRRSRYFIFTPDADGSQIERARFRRMCIADELSRNLSLRILANLRAFAMPAIRKAPVFSVIRLAARLLYGSQTKLGYGDRNC